MNTALVLEGGGMRGMFTVGVLDTMLKEEISYHDIIGVSAGVLFGCNYKSHQPGRALRYNLKYGKDPRYASFKSLITTGDLFNVDFCYREVPRVLDPFDTETFQQDPTGFHLVCTDIETGLPFYYQCKTGDDHDILLMRASGSLPLVATIVEAEGRKLLDGGMSDPIPYKYAFTLGNEKAVVILTQPPHFVKKRDSSLPLIKLLYRKYPKLLRDLELRPLRYNVALEQIHKLEAEGRIFVIQPEAALNIGRTEMDPKELQRVYDVGVKTAEAQMDALKAFLQK